MLDDAMTLTRAVVDLMEKHDRCDEYGEVAGLAALLSSVVEQLGETALVCYVQAGGDPEPDGDLKEVLIRLKSEVDRAIPEHLQGDVRLDIEEGAAQT